MVKLREAKIEQPFVTQIPAQEIAWTTAYAYQGF
jgi:hypothetical protein